MVALSHCCCRTTLQSHKSRSVKHHYNASLQLLRTRMSSTVTPERRSKKKSLEFRTEGVY